MKNLEIMGVQEMDAMEMRRAQGGISFIRIEGWFDGEKGSRGYLFGIKIGDTY